MDVCEMEEVKLKSYFYALRTALAGKWIIENNTFPPVAFADLLPIAPQNIQEKIIELQAIKASQDEKYLHPKEVLITDFLLEAVKFNQQNAGKCGGGKKLSEEFDLFFREMINKKI